MDIYTERTILLKGLITRPDTEFHYYIDDDPEMRGFNLVLCVHIEGYEGSFTWHIADANLKILPFRRIRYVCDRDFYPTEIKYQHLEAYFSREYS